MKSPFPGMDPYLESRWLDLHPRLIVTAARQIQRQLHADLVASIEERVLVEDAAGAWGLISTWWNLAREPPLNRQRQTQWLSPSPSSSRFDPNP